MSDDDRYGMGCPDYMDDVDSTQYEEESYD
jgi:hypothetical protein